MKVQRNVFARSSAVAGVSSALSIHIFKIEMLQGRAQTGAYKMTLMKSPSAWAEGLVVRNIPGNLQLSMPYRRERCV